MGDHRATTEDASGRAAPSTRTARPRDDRQSLGKRPTGRGAHHSRAKKAHHRGAVLQTRQAARRAGVETSNPTQNARARGPAAHTAVPGEALGDMRPHARSSERRAMAGDHQANGAERTRRAAHPTGTPGTQNEPHDSENQIRIAIQPNKRERARTGTTAGNRLPNAGAQSTQNRKRQVEQEKLRKVQKQKKQANR